MALLFFRALPELIITNPSSPQPAGKWPGFLYLWERICLAWLCVWGWSREVKAGCTGADESVGQAVWGAEGRGREPQSHLSCGVCSRRGPASTFSSPSPLVHQLHAVSCDVPDVLLFQPLCLHCPTPLSFLFPWQTLSHPSDPAQGSPPPQTSFTNLPWCLFPCK